jgi:putative nucleotidyltransferase with HDIG domain
MLQRLGELKRLKHISTRLTANLIMTAAFVALFSLIAIAIAPAQYDLTVGAVAPITITATKDIEDTITTERLIFTARESVDLSYISDSFISNEVIQLISDAFRHLRDVNALGYGSDGTAVAIDADMLWRASSTVSPISFENDVLAAVIDAPPEQIQKLYATTIDLVQQALVETFMQNKQSVIEEGILSVLTEDGFPPKLVEAVQIILGEYLRSNMVLDVETIEQNRERAREEIEPVVYKRGQNIVRAGEVVTESQLQMLNDLGMLKNRDMDWQMYVGIGLMLLLMIGLVTIYLFAFERELLNDPGKIALLSIIVVLVVSLSLLVRGLNNFLMPIALGAMLTGLLLKPRLALAISVLLSIIAGVISSAETGLFTTAMFTMVLSSVFSGYLCVAIIKRRPNRTGVMLSGFAAGLSNVLAVYAVSLTNSSNLQTAHVNALWAAGGGVFSAVLCVGILPLLEWTFNLDTPSKLMELSSPNQPLLRRLLLEAPGTYHHSIVVANLAEAAASAIGARGLLARVGAYYHDVGKLMRPIYFFENQTGENPHDRVDPRVSSSILTAHPSDGVQLAQKQRLPQAIQDIILQHHGDALTLYFYDRAVTQGLSVKQEEFRYPGPRPRTKEATIVMLADTVEAAVRALPDSTPESMQNLVNKLIREKLDDGQLDESTMTFKDVNTATRAFMTVLMGVYHRRIEYPDVKAPEREEAPEAKEPERTEETAERLPDA